MKKPISVLLPLTFFVLTGCASMSDAPPPATLKGGMLVDAKGMTLYTFDKDAPGQSNCNGDCAVKWPPMLATAADKATGDYTLVKRNDGRMQWALKGKPLYTWPEDQEPGDKYGDNYLKVWHIIK